MCLIDAVGEKHQQRAEGFDNNRLLSEDLFFLFNRDRELKLSFLLVIVRAYECIDCFSGNNAVCQDGWSG